MSMPKLLTRKEAAELLGISITTLDLLVKNRGLVHYRLPGRQIKFAEEDLEKFVESCRKVGGRR